MNNNCSFCNKNNIIKKKLIIGYNISICEFCIKICNNIIKKDLIIKKDNDFYKNYSPFKIFNELNKYIIGQKEQKKIISVAIYNHLKCIINNYNKNNKININKSNIIMIGESGSGKTLIIKTLSNIIKTPMVIADATSLTEAGYVGDDVESLLYKLIIKCNYNIKKAEKGIIFIDEIDKIAKQKNNYNRDISGEGVQQALLKIIEGTIINISQKTTNKLSLQEDIQIDTTNILFICAGVFKKINNKITHKKLIKYGMINEFIGRIPIIIKLNKLNIKDYKKIIIKPKNSIIKQYYILFKMDNIKLNISKGAIKTIANKVIKKNIGARGIKYIIDKLLINITFNININKKRIINSIKITKKSIINSNKIKIIYKK